MDSRTEIDIRNYTFSEFIDFIFSRDVPQNESEKPWYWNTDVTFDAERICGYYVALFREPSFLLTQFSKPQLEQAFWAIPGENLDCSAGRVIWECEVSSSQRELCVRSMLFLFQKLFALQPLDTSGNMWWDALCYDWHCGNRRRENGGEEAWMQDVMFETLAEILAMDSSFCHRAALHGLGHLHHPATQSLVKHFLASHPSLNPELKDYALAAAQFKVL